MKNELKTMTKSMLKTIRTALSPVTTALIIASIVAYRAQAYFPAMVFAAMYPIIMIMRSEWTGLKRILIKIYCKLSCIYVILTGIAILFTLDQKTSDGLYIWPVLVFGAVIPFLLTKKLFSGLVMMLSVVGVICTYNGIGNSDLQTQTWFLLLWAVSTTFTAIPKVVRKEEVQE